MLRVGRVLISPQARFGAFVVLVLVVPAGLMAVGAPRMTDLGKLAMLLLPGAAGLLLNHGLGDSKARWGWVGAAAAITIAVAAGSLAVAIAAGTAGFRPVVAPPASILAAAGGSALTSVLEELGWAGGGLGLALAALGRRWGVLVLGLVWAAWRLVPTACMSVSSETWKRPRPR